MPSLAAFLEQQPNDDKRGRRIDPPCVECHLRHKPDQDDKGQPPAGDAFNGIGAQRPTPEGLCDPQFTLGQQPHNRDSREADQQPWPREFRPLACPQTPSGGRHDIGRERKQQRSAALAKDSPRRSSTVSRQISTPAEASSIRLSTPKAIRLTLRAIRPEARAIAASTTIHATVSHSSRNAARISCARGVALE